ncbi:MAG: hypothetical protein KH415_12615 [Clostridium sp.]|jgi:hypothetical protein|nr:hypothetical protein [Clostridium sp.]
MEKKKNKKLLTIILVGIIIIFSIIIIIPSKKNSDNVNSKNTSNNSINDESIDNIEEEYTISDLEITKEIAVKFSELIYSIDYKEPLKFTKEATNYVTDSLKERMTQVAKSEPIKIGKREVESVKAIEYKYDEVENLIMWNVEIYANVFDKEGNFLNKEKGDINILFFKDKDQYKVSEYSIESKLKK